MYSNSYLDGVAQYNRNAELARTEPFRTNRYMGKKGEQDMPVILWDDIYNKQPGSLINLFRRVSDWMLFNQQMLYDYDNPNQAYLLDVVAGKLRVDDYFTADTLFGEAGPVPTKDNHFFESARSALLGQVLAHPFQFSTKNLNTAFAEKQILENSKQGAKVMMQALIEAAKQKGMNLDFARDDSVKMPKDEADLLSFMNGQEQIESTVYKLLQHTDYQYSFQNVARKAFDDKFVVNAQFAFVDVVNNEVVPKHYHPDQVRWMASKRIETFEDPNLVAASVMDYMTPTELINQFGVGLNTGTGVRGLYNYLNNVMKVGRDKIGYSPDGAYWTDEGYAGWGLGSDLNDLSIRGYTRKQINWMNRAFYPTVAGAGGLLMNILVQRNFVKMVRQQRYKIRRIQDDHSRPATEKELKFYLENNYDRSLELSFEPIDEKKKESLQGELVKGYYRTEVWAFDRIGHDCFTNVGPYKYQPDPNGEGGNYTGIPIVAQISYKKSMAKLGEQDAIRVNVLYKAIDEYLVNMGFSEVLIIDDAQGVEPLEYLYNAKKSQFARYDSTLMQPTNQAQQRHLQTIKLSNHTEELRVSFALIREITTGYQTRIGLSPQVQGVSERYEGLKETQLNIANQALLLTETLWEHTQFVNQLLQRAGDILKQLNAVDGYKNIILSDGERELLRLSKDMLLADIDVRLESGQLIENKLKLIQGVVQAMAASGGAKDADAMIAAMTTSNPSEAMARLRKLRESMEETEKARQQATDQQARYLADAENRKQDTLLKREQMITEREIELLRMKITGKVDEQDAAGQQADIKEQNERERMALDAELEGNNQQPNQ